MVLSRRKSSSLERWTCDSEGRGFESRPFRFQLTTLGKLFTHVCFCHQARYFGTGQGAVMPCGWEGNRRSGVALAMRHRLQWFIHLRAHGLRKGDVTPPTVLTLWHFFFTQVFTSDGISIGLSVFARLTVVPTRQTHTHARTHTHVTASVAIARISCYACDTAKKYIINKCHTIRHETLF